MKLKTLCALLLHHHGIARALRNSGFAAGQEEFEGAESYAKWHFTASAGAS